MNAYSAETLRRVEQNDDTSTYLCISKKMEGDEEGNFDSPGHYSRLGASVGKNTCLTDLVFDIGNITLGQHESDWDFFNGLKCNSSITDLTIFCRGRDNNTVVNKVLDVYQNNNNLTLLMIEHYDGDDRSAIINVVNSCKNIKSLGLHCCNLTDEDIWSMIESIRRLPLTGQLHLFGNLIGKSGCDAFANILTDPNCTMTQLNLGRNAVTIEGAIAIANSLANNTNLKELHFFGNGLDQSVDDELYKVLCNTTSINSLHSSNHSLDEVTTGGNFQQMPPQLLQLLELNKDKNKSKVAMKKILKYLPILDMEALYKWDSKDERNLKALPFVIAWFERAEHTVDNESDVRKKKLSAIYQFARSMPLMFVPAASKSKIDVKKRKQGSFRNRG